MRHKNKFSTASASTFSRLGQRIRHARKARGITLSELEARCGIHRSTLARLESGDMGVSFTILAAVLEALGKLSDIEGLVSTPEAGHALTSDIPQLNSDF